MKRTSTTLTLAALVLVSTLAFAAPTHAADTSGRGDPADDVAIYERDVYVIVGSTLRNPDEFTAPGAPLFNVAGASLDLTWGEWSSATATSIMKVRRGRSDVKLALGGLVPNGVYSVFYITIGPDSENPLCLNVERALPFASTNKLQVPDRSSFVAGADGTATYAGRVNGDLLAAMQVFVEVIYHYDGDTYHPLPNRGEWLTQGQPECRSSFGDDAMRHVMISQKL